MFAHDVLSQVCEIVIGSVLIGEGNYNSTVSITFKENLLKFRAERASIETKVSSAVIENWFTSAEKGISKKMNEKSRRFIAEYLLSFEEIAPPQIEMRNVLISKLINKVPAKTAPKNTTGGSEQEPISQLGLSLIMKFVVANLNQSSGTTEYFMKRVFNTNFPIDLRSHKDISYFIVFRYSTEEDKIVKSFLVIKTPAETGLEFITFAHFLNSRTSEFDDGNVKKTSRGIVLNLGPATYFVGGTMLDHSPEIKNIEMISIERDTFINTGSVITALSITSAAVNQPIVSRVALVRIGNRSSFPKDLYHDNVLPSEIEDSQLENVIYEDLSRLRKDGFAVNYNDFQIHRIAKLVREYINNIPLAQRQINERSGLELSAVDILSVKGALERWGRYPRA